jgi:hypothetical protein
MNHSRGRRAVAVATLLCAGAAAPAAYGETVDVSLGALGGSRQFAVEDISGNALTAIDLGTGGTQPFRTRVVDQSFSNVTEPYTVSATMSNLYLKTGDTTYDYLTKVPSSEVSLAYPTNPLAALGVGFPVLPDLAMSGPIPSCVDLPQAVKDVLGLDANGLTSDPAVTALCTALGTGVTVTTTGTAAADGLAQQVEAAVTSLLDIPTQLTGAQAGSFNSADYGADTVGFNDPNKPAEKAPTSLQIMKGTPNMTAALKSEIETKINAVLGTLPLTTVDDLGAETTIASAITSLSNSTDTGVADVGSALAALDAAKQSAVINLLGSGLLPVDLSHLANVSGQYFGFPSLKSTPTGLEPGVYDGTLTVTFVQQ